jgi:para-nitrobenzyl esterase
MLTKKCFLNKVAADFKKTVGFLKVLSLSYKNISYMGKKLMLLSTIFYMVCSLVVFGQCPAGRYLYPPLFSSYTITTDTFSTANATVLAVDIYEPTGDTLNARPLIILAHGGSFIGGTRNDDSAIVWLCRNYARRGYVTASIEYRLGNAFAMFMDSSVAIDEVVKAISDGKAAIRFFVKDRATINKYKIDTNNIFIGGNSAGAVLAMQLAYIDSVGQCPPDLVTALNNNGGFEGNSGNAGYTTRFKGVVNLAGGLNRISFIDSGDKPSVNLQGSYDSVVPYYCADPNFGGGLSIGVTLCGLGNLEPQYNAMGVFHLSHVFPGQGHVPWENDSNMFVTVDSLVQVFLYDMVCTPLEVKTASMLTEVSMYPNPSSGNFEIVSPIELAAIVVTDQTGRIVKIENQLTSQKMDMNLDGAQSGLYFVKLIFADPAIEPMVRRLTIE